jgi:hypothetical protein
MPYALARQPCWSARFCPRGSTSREQIPSLPRLSDGPRARARREKVGPLLALIAAAAAGCSGAGQSTAEPSPVRTTTSGAPSATARATTPSAPSEGTSFRFRNVRLVIPDELESRAIGEIVPFREDFPWFRGVCGRLLAGSGRRAVTPTDAQPEADGSVPVTRTVSPAFTPAEVKVPASASTAVSKGCGEG